MAVEHGIGLKSSNLMHRCWEALNPVVHACCVEPSSERQFTTISICQSGFEGKGINQRVNVLFTNFSDTFEFLFSNALVLSLSFVVKVPIRIARYRDQVKSHTIASPSSCALSVSIQSLPKVWQPVHLVFGLIHLT